SAAHQGRLGELQCCPKLRFHRFKTPETSPEFPKDAVSVTDVESFGESSKVQFTRRTQSNHFTMQIDAEVVTDVLFDGLDQREDVLCRGVVFVQDEVPVLERDFGAADPKALQAGFLDESS